MAPKPKPVPTDFASKFLELDGTIEGDGGLAKFYAVHPQTIRKWVDATFGQARHYELTDLPEGRPREMLEERALDPDAWVVERATVNEWTMANGDSATQTKFTVRPRPEPLRPARAEGWKPPKPKARKAGVTETTFLCGDHQAPYIDEDLHQSILRWLAEVKPPNGVIGGDGLDLPSVSKYAKTAGWNASVNECVDSFYRVLCEYRAASPDTRWVMLEGNHEARLHAHLMRQFDEGASIKRAGEGEPLMSIPYLMRLDELGIEYVDNYPHSVHKITPTVGAIHGNIVKKDAGASGHAALIQRGFDLYHFHIHRQALTPHTWHDIDGEPYTRWACEVGAACRVKEGLSHTVNANWQNGAATATVDKEGNHTPELLTWVGGKLRWRGDSW